MKKQYVLVAAIVAVFGTAMAASAYAQSATALPTVPSPGYPLMGMGIAIATNDNTNFSPFAVGIRGDGTSGMASLGQERLTLTNIVVGATSVTATVQNNSTTVGSLTLTPVANSARWTGTATIDGTSYNTYVLSGMGFGMHGRGRGEMAWHGAAKNGAQAAQPSTVQ
jgi:hypothetical protein